MCSQSLGEGGRAAEPAIGCRTARLPNCLVQVGAEDAQYEEYPELSIEEWHKKNNLYVE